MSSPFLILYLLLILGGSTDKEIWIKVTQEESDMIMAYRQQPEQISIIEIVTGATTKANAFDKFLGCRCARKLKDELLNVFLCEKYPDSTFCQKINQDE